MTHPAFDCLTSCKVLAYSTYLNPVQNRILCCLEILLGYLPSCLLIYLFISFKVNNEIIHTHFKKNSPYCILLVGREG